jgi:hypothetical protein
MTAATQPAAIRRTTYDEDIYTWAMEQAALLRAGDLAALDRENLAEEIESLGRREFNSLVEAWCIVLLHILKFDHQPARATRRWAITIAQKRLAGANLLKDSPGLRNRLDEALEHAYPSARLYAAAETELPLSIFPERCPYAISDLLNRPFPIDPPDP